MISDDPEAYLSRFEDREGARGPVVRPDGSQVPRLPSIKRWIWKGGFCGVIGLRWQRGTEALPSYCLGHVGYAVVPWRRREGLASAALQAILPEAQAVGLAYIDVTTDPGNRASIGVIERAGGVLVDRFPNPLVVDEEALRFRIELASEHQGAG